MSNPVTLAPQPYIATAGERGPVTLNVTASGETELIAAPGAGRHVCVTNVWLSNRAASTITASLQEGAGGAARWRGMLAADGGGYTTSFHPVWKLPAATALVVNLSAGGDVDANVQFYCTD